MFGDDLVGRQRLGTRIAGRPACAAAMRSTRNVRQSSRSRSHAKRYQRPRRRRAGTARRRGARRAGVALVVEADALGVAARAGDRDERVGIDMPAACREREAATRNDSTRSRSGEGSSRCSFRSARTDASPIPSTLADVAVRRAIATATASSSSRSIGGIVDRFAEAIAARDSGARLDGVAQPAQPIDVVAHGAGRDFETLGERRPVQSRRTCRSDSRRRSLAEVSSMPPRSHELRKEAFRMPVYPGTIVDASGADGTTRGGDR